MPDREHIVRNRFQTINCRKRGSAERPQGWSSLGFSKGEARPQSIYLVPPQLLTFTSPDTAQRYEANGGDSNRAVPSCAVAIAFLLKCVKGVRQRAILIIGQECLLLRCSGGAPISPLRLMTSKPRPVAESGLRALSRGKASVIPGFMNNVSAFSNRFTPRSMQRATMKRITG